MSEFYRRNLGFIHEREQEKLSRSRIAIAGVGGDGFQLGLKMAMMGVESFSVADPEVFEPENSNRVLGATALAAGLNKAEVFQERVLELRPNAKIDVYTDGVTEDNVEEFMVDADLVLDESELTYPHIGTMIAREARKRDIPVEIAMNIGFSGIVTSLKPDAKYFTFEQMMNIPKGAPLDEIKEMDIDFGWALPYLPPHGDLNTLIAVQAGKSLPSITQGVDIASGVGSTEAFLHLVGGKKGGNNRKDPTWAPHWKYYDAYENKSGKRINIAKVGYYSSLARVAISNILKQNPDCSYWP